MVKTKTKTLLSLQKTFLDWKWTFLSMGNKGQQKDIFVRGQKWFAKRPFCPRTKGGSKKTLLSTDNKGQQKDLIVRGQ